MRRYIFSQRNFDKLLNSSQPQFTCKSTIQTMREWQWNPLSSDRQHSSYDACLEVRGEIIW